MSDDHQSFIKSPRQLIVVVALAFTVPVVVITLFAKFVSTTTRTGAGVDSMSAEAIEARLQPVGRLEVQGPGTSPAAAAPGAAAASPAASSAATTAATAPADGSPAPAAAVQAAASAEGEKIYRASCALCHDAGIAGAPKFGDKAAWGPRIEQGLDVLKKNATQGIRTMPARGGNASLSDAQVHAAVEYLAGAVR